MEASCIFRKKYVSTNLMLYLLSGTTRLEQLMESDPELLSGVDLFYAQTFKSRMIAEFFTIQKSYRLFIQQDSSGQRIRVKSKVSNGLLKRTLHRLIKGLAKSHSIVIIISLPVIWKSAGLI